MGNILDYKPILEITEIHQDTEITKDDFNSIFINIKNDLKVINSEILNSTNDFKNLLESSKSQLNNIKKNLKTEKERLEDINMLCNKFTDFTNAISINKDNAIYDLNYYKDAFSLQEESSKIIKGKITDITGNGYEGNKYVYSNNAFINNTNNSALREYIMDNNIVTYYEYSRIVANNSEEKFSDLINFDSIHAKCSITIQATEVFNNLEISSDIDDISIESLNISQDGKNYENNIISNLQINNKKNRFNKNNYIYGSGIVSFPYCKYLKLILKANSYSKDNIAFSKINSSKNQEIIQLKTAKRSVIKINNIELKKSIYVNEGKLVFSNFITSPINSIAIFANEYCNDELNIRDCIQYTFTINGVDYNVIPINSNYNDKKIIRTTNNTTPAEYVHYINESIKNATLTITMNTNKKYATPYISNLKVLIGGE